MLLLSEALVAMQIYTGLLFDLKRCHIKVFVVVVVVVVVLEGWVKVWCTSSLSCS